MNNPILYNGPRQTPPRMDLENMQLQVGDQLLGTLWVLEYSQSQQAFHRQTLMESLGSNLLGFYKGGRTGDYVILGLFQTCEEADEYYHLMVSRMRIWGLSRHTVDNIDDLLNDLSP